MSDEQELSRFEELRRKSPDELTLIICQMEIAMMQMTMTLNAVKAAKITRQHNHDKDVRKAFIEWLISEYPATGYDIKQLLKLYETEKLTRNVKNITITLNGAMQLTKDQVKGIIKSISK